MTLIFFSTYNAYADVFAKIDSIKGDVTASGFENDIAITSFQFGVNIPISHTAGIVRSGHPVFADLVITKNMDKSSPALLNDLLAGKTIPQMDIFLTRSGPRGLITFAHYTLENVLISSYLVSSGGDNPTESIGFNYEKLTTEVFPQNPDGTLGQAVTFCWDNVLDKECAASVTDNTPPTLLILSPANNTLVNTATPTISGTSSDDTSVSSVTWNADGGSVSIASGTTSWSFSPTLTDGSHIIEINATDSVGLVTSKVLTIGVDTVPPVTTATPSGTVGNNGWFRSIVSVVLSATDNLSGVASTSYTLDGNAQVSYTGPITVTGNGTHSMTFNSTDNVGNVESSNSLTIKIDNVPPTVTGTANMSANVNGWYSHPLQISWAGTDLTSGVASCDSPTIYSGPDSLSVTLAGHCTDNAGNIGSATLSIKYDSTPPALVVPSAITLFPTSPTGTVVTFSNTNGTAASATDVTSGLVGITYAPASGTRFSFGTTAVMATATDNAGNAATGSFNVIVLTPTQASQKLISIIGSYNLDQGTTNSLDSKLNAAMNSLNSNQNNTAKNQLNAFINEVNAQSGKKISNTQASQLLIFAQDIIKSIS